ncbi:MAG: hypothetical protein H0V14_08770 [Chitinophagaceae bacterium]|nr:hypothetical protein [Chitinophagaceae bacterium]MBA3675479.1 hypothetical protein [Chitinophagaceae bacterium]
MNLHFQDLIPEDFNDDSKVWIYQGNRQLNLAEALQIEELLQQFAKVWKSHGAEVKGYAKLLFGQFIILMADETATGVSGCSTDSSVKLMKSIEQDYNIDLFNRQLLAFIVKERIQILPLNQLNNAIENDLISPDTLYFNNTVQTKKELIKNWLIPVKDSWLAKRLILTS